MIQSNRIWRENLRRGVKIGFNCKIHRTAILDLIAGGSIELGLNVELGAYSVLITHGGRIDVGDNVYVGIHSLLQGDGGLSVGKNTMIASHVAIIPSSHGIKLGTPMRLQSLSKKGISIGEDCWIGAGVQVLDGVSIGDGCVIGAGSVVTKSINSGMIAFGSPAREGRSRC